MRDLTRTTRWTATLCAVVWLGACADPLPEDPASYEPYQAGELDPIECVPNLDGQIDSAEAAAQFDVPARFLVSPAGQTRSVDLAGRPRGDQFVWDWSYQNPADQMAVVEATPLADQWYADSFPEGQLVTAFDLDGTLEAIYSRTDQALRLHGLASAQPDSPAGKTLMVYQTPVDVYRFPIEAGRQWVSVGEVRDGTFRGLPYAGRDTYEVSVTATGELRLPSFTFSQVHQVHTKVTVQPAAGESTTTRQVSFLFECFGEVARATSREGETEQNFSTAAEVRRLGFER